MDSDRLAVEPAQLLDPATLTERQALFWYLRAEPSGGPVQFVSSYHAALRDARNVTGRDPSTGVIVSPPNTGTWLGAVGYLSFLDQVGTALRPRHPGRARRRGTSIEWSLAYFDGGLTTTRDREALYALRCSLAHDYSLFNQSKGNSKRAASLRFRFQLEATGAGPIVVHARRRWSGDFNAPYRTSQETVVNLESLGSVAETVHENVQAAWSAGAIRSRLRPAQLVVRYGLFICDPGGSRSP